jgi:hypothetical protein
VGLDSLRSPAPGEALELCGERDAGVCVGVREVRDAGGDCGAVEADSGGDYGVADADSGGKQDMNEGVSIGVGMLAMAALGVFAGSGRKNRVKRWPRWQKEREERRRKREQERNRAAWMALGTTVRGGVQ